MFVMYWECLLVSFLHQFVVLGFVCLLCWCFCLFVGYWVCLFAVLFFVCCILGVFVCSVGECFCMRLFVCSVGELFLHVFVVLACVRCIYAGGRL